MLNFILYNMEKELNLLFREDGTVTAVYSEGGQEVATMDWDRAPKKLQELLNLTIDMVKEAQANEATPDTTDGPKMF